MGVFDLFSKQTMDAGVEEFRRTPQAVLLDVRTGEEYAQGHVEGSYHLALDQIASAAEVFPDKNTPLFVHCRSGARSGQAVSYLKQMGYRRVKNIGGILEYHGKVVK